ncbi:hypothetical protein EXN66_Car016217 [Channa argus]|uniref:Uncharacterized protein n=1 Tax=Channa argus TaxID=215402 RepID=A0A6G1QCY4_CHAAH|nr:hypothetical protein EXN66_Car016217 [Channa argus]
MSQNGGQCCLKLFLILSSLIVMEGLALAGFGVALHYRPITDQKNPGDNSTNVFNVLIGQGALMVILGTCGIGCALAKSSALKVFYVLLAFLALADIIFPMVYYFHCKQGCTLLPSADLDKEKVMGVFLVTAVVQIITLVSSICLLKQRQRLNVEFSAHFKATS